MEFWREICFSSVVTGKITTKTTPMPAKTCRNERNLIFSERLRNTIVGAISVFYCIEVIRGREYCNSSLGILVALTIPKLILWTNLKLLLYRGVNHSINGIKY